MKILLIESAVTGHHLSYLNAIIEKQVEGNEVYVILPEKCEISNKVKKQINIKLYKDGKRDYFKWIKKVNDVIDEIEPDLVHFIYADDLYRYFGIGIKKPVKYKSVLTVHQLRRGKLHDLSIRMLSAKFSSTVVHTAALKETLGGLKIKTVDHIEYPQFGAHEKEAQEKALESLGINKDEIHGKVLLCLGGTREDKGLDILLEALKEVKEPYHLIVAGAEQHFKRDFIEKEAEGYKDKVSLFLEFLSEEKFGHCLNAADILVLPYKKAFDGASGPLGEGVWVEKEIIGPSHGSLGDIIEKHHLGRTFEAENAQDLRRVISEELKKNDFEIDEKYKEYHKMMDVERFKEDYDALYKRVAKVK